MAGSFYIDELTTSLEYLQHIMDDCYLDEKTVARWEAPESRDSLSLRIEATSDFLLELHGRELAAWAHVRKVADAESRSRFLETFGGGELTPRAAGQLAGYLKVLKRNVRFPDRLLDPFISKFEEWASGWKHDFENVETNWGEP